MSILRRLLLVVSLAALLAPRALAMGESGNEGMLVIMLEHHWVVEFAGERFGLIQFDTPSTTILLGGLDIDVPIPAFAVLAPLVTVPLLAAVGVIMHGRRRRLGF